jgi:predicted chitinase
MADDFDMDWGDDPFSGDMSFDSDFDTPSNHGFLRSFTTGFLSGLVEKTVGDTDARIDTLKMVLPRSYLGAFSTLSDLNRRRAELMQEIKGDSYESVKDLQYLAGRAADKLRKIAPNKIADGFQNFSQNDFSDWEKASSGGRDSGPSLSDTTEDEIKSAIDNADANSVLERETMIGSAGAITDMMANVGGRTLANLQAMGQGTVRTNQLLEQIVDFQRRVQARNDALKLNIMTRSYLTDAKFYKFVEASNHRIVEELKKISDSSAKSDYEKTTHSQAVRKTIRESVFSSVKSKIGGISGFIDDRFGKNARGEFTGGSNELISSIRMAAEMTEGMDLNLGQMLGNAAAGIFINNLPRMLKSGKAKKYLDDFKKKFPAQAKWAEDAYIRITDLGNVASYGLTNAEGLTNTMAKYYQGGQTWSEAEDYEQYLDLLPEGEQKLSKVEWTLISNARKIGNKAFAGVFDNMSRSNGTQYTLARRTLDNGHEQALWNNRSDRTLNEVLPQWLSQIHLSLEKFRTGDDDMRAMTYDYVKGKFNSHDQKISTVLNQVLDKRQFSNQATMANNLAEQIDADGALTPEAKRELAFLLAKDTDADMGFSPYNYLHADKEHGVPPALAAEIKRMIQVQFGISDDHIKAFNEGTDVDRSKALIYMPTEKGRQRVAELAPSAKSLGAFAPDITNRLDVLKSSGYYDAMKEAGIVTTTDGQDNVDMEKIWGTLKSFIQDTKRETAPRVPDAVPLPSRAFGGGYPPQPAPPTPGPLPLPGPTPVIPESIKLDGLEDLTKSMSGMEGLKETMEQLGKSFSGYRPPDAPPTVDIVPITTGLEGISAKLEQMLALGTTRNQILTDILLRQPAEAKPLSESDEKEVSREKKSLLDKLKGTSFKDLFNSGVEKLMDNQPLILGGLLGGLAGLAVYDKKSAALLAGGAIIAGGYMKLKSLKSKEADDTQDLYEEGAENPILEASKLQNGDYYDATKGFLIKSWKDITGSVVDNVTKVVIGARRLAGKLFTSENKEVFLSGLDKVREYLLKAYHFIDPFKRVKRWGNALRTRFYQMDVYKEGEDSPTLVGKRFESGAYCKRNESGELEVINGWNEIDGPVYTPEGEVIITQDEYDRGLRTSMGVSVNKLQEGSKKLGRLGLDFLGKVKDKALPMMGMAADKAKGAMTVSYAPIVNSVDRIYNLLLKHWGYQQEVDIELPEPTVQPVAGPTKDQPGTPKGTLIPTIVEKPEADVVDPNRPFPKNPSIKPKTPMENAVEKVKEDLESNTPQGRLNSLADKKEKSEEKRKADSEEALIYMAKNFGFGAKPGEEEKKKSQGLFGLLASGFGAIASGIAGITTFFTKRLFSGFQTLFRFGSLGLKVFPILATGITAVAKGIFTLIKTRSVTEAGGSVWDTLTGGGEEDAGEGKKGKGKKGKKGKKGEKAPRTAGSRLKTGVKGVGYGMAAGMATDFLMDSGIVDEDSATGTVLDAASTAATAYGGYQMAAGVATAAGLDISAGAVATGVAAGGAAAASWVGGTAAAGMVANLGIAALPMLLNPYVLGAIAVGAVGYGIYRFVNRGEGKQFELRMAQYGVSDPDSDLAKKILKAEEMLLSHVVIGNGRASFSKQAPISEVIQMFVSDPKNNKEVGDVFTWFNGRFKPVLLTYMACLDTIKMKSLKEYDEGKTQDIYKVAKQTHAALNGVQPYPYSITAKIDADTPILGEKATLIRVNNLLGELKDYIDRKTPSEDLNPITTPKAQSKAGLEKEKAELKQTVEGPRGFFDSKEKMARVAKAETRLQQVDEEIKRLNDSYKAGGIVAQIYIKDLMPDDKAMDLMTAIRAACYGNEEDVTWRVEAVMKLERYCEPLFADRGESMEFTGQIGQIFSLFKDSFRVSDGDADDWCLWFRDRFLPVLTTYMNTMKTYRRGRPAVVWKTLSATARYEIAKALVETKGKGTLWFDFSIWTVRASPFKGTKSPAKPDKVDRMLKLLGEASTAAKLKDPEAEAGKTNAQTWAKTVSPHKVGGDFQPEAPNVDDVSKAKTRGEVAGGGQFGTNGSGTGNTYSAGGVYQTPSNKYGFVPLGGDSDTSHLDMSGVKAQEGNDKGVKVPKKLAQQILIREMLKQGFTDPREIAEVLALTDYESGGYQNTTESLKYSDPKRLASMFREVKSVEQARMLIDQGEVAIANTVYGGGKGASIGNREPGDGWKYRGRGFIQLTGKANYAKTGQELGIDLVNKPELASNDPNVMAAVAVNFFKNSKLLRSISQTGNFGEAAKGLNGGNELPGMPKRYQLYLSYLEQLQKGELSTETSTAEDPAAAEGQTAGQMYGGGGSSGGGSTGAPAASGGGGEAPMMGSGNLPSLANAPAGGGASGNYQTPAPAGGGGYGSNPEMDPAAVPFSGPYQDSDLLVNSNASGTSGLRLKSAESVAGGKAHPGLTALCKMIQQRVPGFKVFTALNDAYHVNKGSKGAHPKGLAADFTLTNGIAGSDRAATMVTEILRQAGLQPGAEFLVINEYKRKTAIGTGGHVHAGFKSPAAAQKFLDAAGGTQTNGQDTTGTGGGAEVAPEEAPNRAQPTLPPGNPMSAPDEEGGAAAPSAQPASAAPGAGFTGLPLPNQPPPQQPLPEGYKGPAPAPQAPAPVAQAPKAAPAPATPDNSAQVAELMKSLIAATQSSGGDNAQLLKAVLDQLVQLNKKGEKTPQGVKVN